MPSLSFHRFARARSALLILVGMGLFFALPAGAVTVSGLYTAEVNVADRTEANRPDAFRRAMRDVLARITGRRDISGIPELNSLVDASRRYVQQYRYTSKNDSDFLRVVFDGSTLQRAVSDTGAPIWGIDRPAVLVWLAIDGGGDRRRLVGSTDSGNARRQLISTAERRGVPLILPLLDAEDRSRVRYTDVSGGFDDKVRMASARYRPDAILTGRGRASGSRMRVNWELDYRGSRQQFSGTIEEGVHFAADIFAREFSVAGGSGLVQDAYVSVGGISSVDGYGRVSRFLEKLGVAEGVNVYTVTGDTVVYRVTTRGDTFALERAIGLGRILTPDDTGSGPPGILRYRYRP